MHKLTLLTAAAMLVLIGGCSTGTADLPADLPHNSSALPAQAAQPYVVVLASSATAAQLNMVAQASGVVPTQTYDVALKGFAASLSSSQLASLRANPLVRYIEPDVIVSAYAQTTPWGVDRIDADLNANEGSGIGVAVIDTGVNLTHSDLSGVVAGANFVRSGSPPEDDNGHGTHVAGTIAAVNNTIGYVGVASQAKIVAVKVLDRRGSGQLSWVIAGVNWVAANAAAQNIKVANMSLGVSGYYQSLHDAIAGATAQGVTFVVAAGNSSANAANYSPSGFDDCVITVSAMNSNNTFASYSNWGSVVDLIAPGTNVQSLWKSNTYKTISGTSMASPHVAGAAALYIKNHPSAGFTEVRDALVAAGESGTWAGDPDGISEKLVDAQSL